MDSNRTLAARATAQHLSRWIAAAGLVIATSIAPTAGAQPVDPIKQVSAADKDTARGLMDDGHKKFAVGDYAGALKAYEGADAIMEVPTTGLGVGKARMQLGKLLEARDVLLRVGRYPKLEKEPTAFAQARAQASALAKSLSARIPKLTLQVSGIPEGAAVTVTVDGVTVDPRTFGLPRRVNPGKHEITAKGRGFHDLTKSVSLQEGASEALRLELKRDGTPVKPLPEPPAETPNPDKAKPPGGEAELSPLVWVGFGVGAAGLLVGAITGAMSLSAASDAKADCRDNLCPRSAESDADKAKVLGHTSTVSFAIGGAGAALGVIALVFLSGSDGEPDADVSARAFDCRPMAGPGFVGVAGSF